MLRLTPMNLRWPKIKTLSRSPIEMIFPSNQRTSLTTSPLFAKRYPPSRYTPPALAVSLKRAYPDKTGHFGPEQVSTTSRS